MRKDRFHIFFRGPPGWCRHNGAAHQQVGASCEVFARISGVSTVMASSDLQSPPQPAAGSAGLLGDVSALLRAQLRGQEKGGKGGFRSLTTGGGTPLPSPYVTPPFAGGAAGCAAGAGSVEPSAAGNQDHAAAPDCSVPDPQSCAS